MIKETPKNIEELKKKANNKNSWRDRLSAVTVLKEYDCRQSKDILTRLAIHDPVFKVKNPAFRAAQALGVTIHGKPIYLGKRKKGNLVKGINKKLEKVRNSLPDDYSFEDFKSEFQKKCPNAYDVYEGTEKDFDGWLKKSEANLPHRK
ncbi:hypothetical protein [Pediococcus parvulus]|uniref:hypothetical protein n=1 Tax=Pediococcus parvulus TaxID=54062 RepID=UPI00070E1D85|nr:hypothetical protein [Pediococcus parvulus]MCT3027464.1 hypothetical protein [Pediococcus parvulus]GEL90460.1 hypothetical protein PPA04_16910 [Pediococcus parvulus]GHC12835.1 hypothetical protein GCM10008912_15530 [Pediococcus parvulus]